MKKDNQPNPQGKGINRSIGFLLELEAGFSVLPLKDDSRERIVEDYINSLVALSCSFKFKPVIGKKYYMYLMNKKWLLSLVGPDQGGTSIFEKFIAYCRLREDATWEMKFVNGHDLGISDIGDKKFNFKDNEINWVNGVSPEGLSKLLSNSELGRYRKDLGYYQNVLHFSLSKAITFRTKRMLELGSETTNSEKTKFIEE